MTPEPTVLRFGLFARIVRAILMWLYRRHRWTVTGVVPSPRRFVMIAAPHTSNWDFPYFLGLLDDLGIRAHFMAKKSLFRWPFADFMRQVGGVPVDRTAASDTVDQMIAEFARRGDFMLTIAPEGTRGATAKWRTGFYRIALGAGVPIVCGYMDYALRMGGIGPVIVPTGDYDTDMAPVFAFYAGITGKHRERMTPTPG